MSGGFISSSAVRCLSQSFFHNLPMGQLVFLFPFNPISVLGILTPWKQYSDSSCAWNVLYNFHSAEGYTPVISRVSVFLLLGALSARLGSSLYKRPSFRSKKVPPSRPAATLPLPPVGTNSEGEQKRGAKERRSVGRRVKRIRNGSLTPSIASSSSSDLFFSSSLDKEGFFGKATLTTRSSLSSRACPLLSFSPLFARDIDCGS